MTDTTPILSVLCISHEQRELLRRCMTSILAQKIRVPWEIIISDDRSTDGTFELAQEYAEQYKKPSALSSSPKGGVIDSDSVPSGEGQEGANTSIDGEWYVPQVCAIHCNSDECDPNYTLERAGYNRLNGLKYATGKYLIHVDGDDYFLGTDCFEEMVQTLEAHPECTLCCQNFRWVDDGVDPSMVKPFCTSPLFEQEQIITPEDYVKQIGFVHNSAICMRRGETAYLERLSGNTYDDADITFRYMGSGKIALLNRSDFVYVQYNKSSCTSMSNLDKLFIFQNGLTSIQLNSSVAGILLENNVDSVKAIAKCVVRGIELPQRLIDYFKNFDLYIYKQLEYRNIPFVRLRYFAMYVVGLLIKKGDMRCKPMYRLLYRFVVNWNIDKNVKF